MQRFVDLAVQGGETIASSAAPAPATPGLRMVVVAGLALVWWTVDLVAVVLRRPAVAGLALLAVYCVPTALVRSGLPWWWFVLAAAGYLVLVASDAQERVSRWGRVVGSSGSGDVEERASLSATGRRVGALALAAAVVVPALVPGLSESLLPAGNLPGNGPGDGTIAVLNPILSLRDDLTANDDVTVLEYTTEDPTPDPLRLVTVDSFDGDTWQPTYGDIDRDQRAAGNFPAPPGLAAAAGATQARTSITDRRAAAGLAAHALPADPDRHHRQLALRRDHPQRRRRRRADHRGPALLRAAPAGRARPGGPGRRRSGAGRHRHPLDGAARRARPRPSPPRPLTVAGEGTQLDQATRLQSWFRSGGGFSYSLDAPPENGSSAVADFLDRRSGYCVHFASAMALMARSLGIPARVAVGWLPGEQVEPGTYRVSQQDAHAWPELYFEGVGWMRFEPTPATRAGTVPGWAAPTTPEPTDAPTTAAPSTSASANAPTAPRDAEGGETTTDRDLLTVLRAIPWRVVVALLLVLAVLAAPAVTAVVVRRRRWSRATTPAARAEVAWTTLVEELGDRGVHVPAALTVRQATEVVTDGLGAEATTSMRRIARSVERQRYAPPPGTGLPRRAPGRDDAPRGGARPGRAAGPAVGAGGRRATS